MKKTTYSIGQINHAPQIKSRLIGIGHMQHNRAYRGEGVRLKLKTEGLEGDDLAFVSKLNERFGELPAIHSLDEIKEEAKSILEDLTTKGFSATAITVPGTGKDGGADKTLDQFLREYGTQLAEAKEAIEKAGQSAKVDPLTSQAKTIAKVVEDVKKLKNQAGDSPFSVSSDSKFDSNEKTDKVAVVMTSGNTTANASGVTVPANYMYGVEGAAEPDVRIDPYITDFVDNGRTDLPAFPYADKLPTEGTMAITAEGALKPLLSVSIERRFSTAFKIAGRSKVTEEGLDDITGLQSLINGELKYSHDIAEQNAIYTHVTAFAPAFVAGGLAASTDAPSNWDVIRAAIYAVKIASKGRFMPNAAVINSADAYAMGATKDANHQYVIPTFVLPDGTKVSGVKIIETTDDTNIPAGTFIVGDWRKVKRRVYKPFNLRIGQGITGSATAANITSDFETNMYTIIGESRLHLWHYKNNETAFIKSTFAAVKAAIDATV